MSQCRIAGDSHRLPVDPYSVHGRGRRHRYEWYAPASKCPHAGRAVQDGLPVLVARWKCREHALRGRVQQDGSRYEVKGDRCVGQRS
jgi:hypothetical protein